MSQDWLADVYLFLHTDETVVNGAQIFYAEQFGIKGDGGRETWLLGLVNSAPYLCCAVLGCWLTVPFNALLGRRGTIFATCVISAATVVWQAFTHSWQHMFVARFALGLGIGPKSATVPIWAAECTPPAIRGALVMQWQMWTAFGIMLGYVADLALFKVRDPPGVRGLNWRLMLASAMLPALAVCAFVFVCPESPRWYMARGRHEDAYRAMVRLRYCRVQAARDLFYMHTLLKAEADMARMGRSKLLELVTVPRNRRALVASEIVMFMQQVGRGV
jgi:MFS family permease